MTRSAWRRGALSIMAALLAATAGVGPASSHAAASGPTWYLALGDSWAFGYQPNGDFTHGYVPTVYTALHAQDANLQLLNLACPGETSASMLDGPPAQAACAAGYGLLGATDQLGAAVNFLATHSVSVITIGIGGNDIADCITVVAGVVGVDLTCYAAVMQGTPVRLAAILTALHAASPSTPIVGVTYDDPLLATWLIGQQKLARQSVGLLTSFDSAEGAVYDELGSGYADIAGAFLTTRWMPVDTGLGRLPLNVATVCTLTWACSQSHFLDIHPNTTGYGVIAVTVLGAVVAAGG